ncbi:MAG: hypothetical protein D6732_19285 [Methanobacteriota archaeon]|nr:MAG: hypothetical protein D6732_19285 [Euryarchaeota archaeon]
MQKTVPDSLFNLFYRVEELNSNIYKSSAYHETASISDIWEKFITDVFPLLVKLLEESSLLFERYYDEFRIIQENQENQDMKILTRLKNIIELRAHLVFLAFTYNNFLSEGIFDFRSEHATDGKIKVISNLHSMLDLFFDIKLPLELFESISDIAKRALHTLKNEKLIPMIESTLISNPDNIFSLLEGWQEIGDFYNLSLPNQIKLIAEDWWWEDPLALYHLHDQGERYYLKILEVISAYPDFEYKENLKQVKERSIPISKTLAFYNLSRHHLNVAMAALREGNFKTAREFLEQSSNFARVAYENVMSISYFKGKGEILEEITEHLSHVENLVNLSEIALKFQDLFETYDVKKPENTLNLIKELIVDLEGFSTYQSRDYATIILLYNISLSNGQFVLSRRSNPSTFRKEILKPFETFKHTVYSRLPNFFNLENPLIVRKHQEEMEEIHFVSLFFPGEVDEKQSFVKLVESIQRVLKAKELDEKVEIIQQDNIILSILLQTRAYFYLVSSGKTLEPLLNEQLQKIFQRYIFETQSKVFLFQNDFNQLILQYITIHQILQRFTLIAIGLLEQNQQKDDTIIVSIKNAIEDDQKFSTYIDLVQEGYLNLLNIASNQEDIPPDLVAKIKAKLALIDAIKKFYGALKNFFLGLATTIHGKPSNALQFFGKAKDQAFEAARILERNSTEEPQEQLLEDIFSFGVLSQHHENSPSQVTVNMKNVEKILLLLKGIIFNL